MVCREADLFGETKDIVNGLLLAFRKLNDHVVCEHILFFIVKEVLKHAVLLPELVVKV